MKRRSVSPDAVEGTPDLDSVWDRLLTPEAAALVAPFSSLFWPRFVEHRGCVLLVERFDPQNFERWWEELDGDHARVERVINHVHLWDLFVNDESDLADESLSELAAVLSYTWRASLEAAFPSRAFDVIAVTDDPSEYGPTVTFFSTVPMS